MNVLKFMFKYSALAFASCSIFFTLKSSAQGFKESKVFISGSIKKFDKEKHLKSVVFMVSSAFGEITKKAEIIDSTGRFMLETFIASPQDISIQYENNTAELFLRPGDSLKIELGVLPFINIIDGTLAVENRMIQEFKDKRTTDHYKNPKGVSSLFDKWATDYTRYEAWSKLIEHYNEEPLLEDSVSYFLKNYNMNHLPVISGPYTHFISGLYRYFTHSAPQVKSALFAEYAKERNFLGIGGIFAEGIKSSTTGLTRELLLTMLFMDALNGQQLTEFKALWNKYPVLNTYLKSKILAKSAELEASLKNQKIKDESTLVQINQAGGGSVLDSIIMKFPEKVIYIDFWAPWCSPCMAAMPKSKELQHYYKSKDIAFVFFASQCSDESWKSTIANQALTGTHYKLTNDQFNVLSSKFDINGIPHYVIINKEGKIANGNAPGPEQKEGLKHELDRLLK
ncbi:TlpA family protein disulfide reductase [Pedobacter ginsengisoli]|nr:TlpA disulfide reductase family protein [Pedobacter ginsengisoli]